MNGGWGAARISNFFIQRIRKVNFSIKNPNLTKKILAVGRGWGRGVARVSDSFFLQKNPSLKK